MDLSRRKVLFDTAAFLAAYPLLGTRSFAEPSGKKYKACIIGHTGEGDYGHYLHQVFSHRSDVDVVGLSDPDAAARKKHAEEAKAIRTYSDYQEMLITEKPDLVSVGPRWTNRHKEYVLAAAKVGAHGLLEKPISTDLAEADEMIDAIKKENLKWCIAFQKRFYPDIQQVKRQVFEEGLIGDILELRGHGKEDQRAGGEDLVVLGTHIFDLMVFFMESPPLWCESFIGVDGGPATPADIKSPEENLGPVVGNQIHAKFMFDGGTPAYFNSMKNRDGNGGRFGLDIYGTRGIVKIRLTRVPKVSWLPTTSWYPDERTGEWQDLPGEINREVSVIQLNAGLIDDLIDSIEKDREPKISLEDGVLSYEMVQSVFVSHIQGGRVPFPLEQREHPLKNW